MREETETERWGDQ